MTRFCPHISRARSPSLANCLHPVGESGAILLELNLKQCETWFQCVKLSAVLSMRCGITANENAFPHCSHVLQTTLRWAEGESYLWKTWTLQMCVMLQLFLFLFCCRPHRAFFPLFSPLILIKKQLSNAKFRLLRIKNNERKCDGKEFHTFL